VLPDSSREHFVRHPTFGGRGLFPNLGVDLDGPYRTDSQFYLGFNGPVITVDYREFGARYKGVVTPSHSFIATYDERFAPSLPSWFHAFSDFGETWYGGGTQYWRAYSTISRIVDTHTELSCIVETNLSLQAPYYGYPDAHYSWKYKLAFNLYAIRASFGYYDAGLDGQLFAFIGDSSAEQLVSLDFLLKSCDLGYDVNDDDIFLSLTPSFPKPGSDHPATKRTAKTYTGPDEAVVQFRGFIDSVWDDVVPSACFSAVDAVADVEHGTTTDVLQTLYKLPQYEAMIPKVGEAIKVLGDLVHRDLSLSTLKEIIDIASATVLQASFQWRPLLDLLLIQLPKMVASVRATFTGSSLVVGRGKFAFHMPAKTFLRNEVSLLTRTKIVLDISTRALVSNLMGFDALGIFPKVSNLWDLIPFSFIANWFTGVGAGIRRLEYASALLTIPAYYVHSYTISSPFTLEELEEWNLMSDSRDPLSLRVHYRDLSLYAPLPRDSRFGFGIPTRLPPLGTVASLLWQLFL
jgi:hypothetical protein